MITHNDHTHFLDLNRFDTASNSFVCLSFVHIFQADNKGETGIMGFPGLRVSTDTFVHMSSRSCP